MDQNKNINKFESLVLKLEAAAVSMIKFNANIVIETLEQTQKALDHAEVLARRLVDIKSRLDRFAQNSETTLKQQAIHTCQDSTEVGLEIVKSLGIVAQASLSELKEFGYNSGDFIKETLDSAKDIGKPFNQKHISRNRNSTIIPISIQDN